MICLNSYFLFIYLYSVLCFLEFVCEENETFVA
jgi:hypothetical protein